jgi:hypothetical protein
LFHLESLLTGHAGASFCGLKKDLTDIKREKILDCIKYDRPMKAGHIFDQIVEGAIYQTFFASVPNSLRTPGNKQ